MKLKLWIAEQDYDSSCYNLISKTKKDLMAEIEKNSHNTYHTIFHVEINYKDAFDLFDWITGEGGGRNGNSYKVIKEINL